MGWNIPILAICLNAPLLHSKRISLGVTLNIIPTCSDTKGHLHNNPYLVRTVVRTIRGDYNKLSPSDYEDTYSIIRIGLQDCNLRTVNGKRGLPLR